MKTFSDVLTIINGRNQKGVENPNGRYPIYGSGGIISRADQFLCEKDTVIVGRKGTINRPLFVEEPFWNVDTAFGLVAKKEVLFPKYLYFFCCSYDFLKLSTTVTIPSLTKANLLKIQINLPDIISQQNIAAVLDRICALKRNAEAQLAQLKLLAKSQFVEMFGDPLSNEKEWPVEELGNRCRITTGNTPPRSDADNYGSYVEWVKSDNLVDGRVLHAAEMLSEKGAKLARYAQTGDLLMTCIAGSLNSIGNASIVDRPVTFNQQINAISPLKDNPVYMLWLFRLAKPILHEGINKVLKGILNKGNLSKKQFPFPPRELQDQFSAFIEQLDKSVFAVNKLIEQYDLLYRAKLQEYFG